MREIEKRYLKEKVSWHSSIQDIPEINGCILSNELVDNFSVHQLFIEEELKEIFVDFYAGFAEILRPANQKLIHYFKTLNVQLPKAFCTEVNLQAISWMKEVSLSLQKGYIITIDYGLLSNELYNNRRGCGTLLCYHKHQKNDNPYQFISEQDITTYINFSALS